jgi:hypothetical protein
VYDLARLLGHKRRAWLARLASLFQLMTPGLTIVGAAIWLLGQLGGMGGTGQGGDWIQLGVTCLQAAAGAWGLGALCLMGLLASLMQALVDPAPLNAALSEEEGGPRLGEGPSH